MRIAIRLDDITPGMDRERFGRLKALMDQHGVRPLIGVVPDCRDPKLAVDEPMENFWEFVRDLKERQGWSVAMHGCHHVYTTKEGGIFPLGRKSEFAGLPYERQKSLLETGKSILAGHGIDTDIFMAPGHSYDDSTLAALKECGFCAVTDGYGSRPYRWKGLTFYPIAFHRTAVLSRARSKEADRMDPRRSTGLHRLTLAQEGDETTTFVIHTNTMSDKELAFYDNLFSTQDIMPFDALTEMTAVNRTTAGRWKEQIMAAAKRAAAERLL